MRLLQIVPAATLVGALIFVGAASMGVSSCTPQAPTGGPLVGTATCLACHDGRSAPDRRGLLEGAHRGIECEECHGSGYDHVRNGGRGGHWVFDPSNQSFDQAYTVCNKCHAGVVDGYLQSKHFLNQAARCVDCHDVHTRLGMAVTPAGAPDHLPNESFAQLCGTCHPVEVEGELKSVHATLGVATCASCHNVHTADGLAQSAVDNTVCLQCHASFQLGFTSPAIVDAHTGVFHPVDPAGSGASRCTSCHLPPLSQTNQPQGAHDHSLFTVPPSASNAAITAGTLVPPNSCSGAMGCHDAAVPGSGTPYNVNNASDNATLQPLYDSIGHTP